MPSMHASEHRRRFLTGLAALLLALMAALHLAQTKVRVDAKVKEEEGTRPKARGRSYEAHVLSRENLPADVAVAGGGCKRIRSSGQRRSSWRGRTSLSPRGSPTARQRRSRGSPRPRPPGARSVGGVPHSRCHRPRGGRRRDPGGDQVPLALVGLRRIIEMGRSDADGVRVAGPGVRDRGFPARGALLALRPSAVLIQVPPKLKAAQPHPLLLPLLRHRFRLASSLKSLFRDFKPKLVPRGGQSQWCSTARPLRTSRPMPGRYAVRWGAQSTAQSTAIARSD